MGIYALTGSGSGIGATLAKKLADEGHTVINIDVKNAEIIADLSTDDGRQAAITAINELAPDGLDGLVPLAGLGGDVPNGGLVCAVNYFGSVGMVEGLRGLLVKKQGAVVLLSSNSAAMDLNGDELIDALLAGDQAAATEVANAKQFAGIQYMLSKRALAYWMRSNVASFAKDGVRMNAIAPGVIATPMTNPLFETMSDVMNELVDGTPLQRMGQPEEIADFIRYLLSPQSSFICGSVLFIDGGYDAVTRTKHI